MDKNLIEAVVMFVVLLTPVGILASLLFIGLLVNSHLDEKKDLACKQIGYTNHTLLDFKDACVTTEGNAKFAILKCTGLFKVNCNAEIQP